MKQERELKDKEEALKAEEQALAARKMALDSRERTIAERERISREIGEVQERPLSKEDEKLISEALKTYKIPRKYLFHARIDAETGEAVIVTSGGKKLRHRKGSEAKFQLDEVQITGQPPKEGRRWSKRFNSRLSLKEIFKG
jgi:hypothetical protein